MTEATAKNFPIARAPRRIELLGDKTKRLESAEHIIEFPGGAIEVARLDNGDYWAHIIVNRRWAHVSQGDSLKGALGEIVGSRITRFAASPTVVSIDDADEIEQVAVLIRPVRP